MSDEDIKELLKEEKGYNPMPTNKTKEIDDFLAAITGISRQQAEINNICVWCKQPLTKFRDKLSEREHQISGLCQKCQDETFGK